MKDYDIVDDDLAQIRKKFLNAPKEDTVLEKIGKNETFRTLVPFGVVLTTGALCYGLIAGFKDSNKKVAQNMMRLRIAAQGFTVAALVLSSWIMKTKKQRNNN